MFHTVRTAIIVALAASCCLTTKLAINTVVASEPNAQPPKMNVLFIISDDLTATALSCYGNTVCQTPNIDAIAARGTRFTRTYCQGSYCGPSRASLLSGYYPHATGVLGYTSPRPQIGDRATWPQHFKNNGYYTARVSKIYHMGVPGGVQLVGDGRDHNNKGFTLWMAGGGVKGGISYGATDDYGYEAVEDRMHIHDWHATLLHLLGLDHERLTFPYAGRDFRLTDVHGTVARKIFA